MYVIDKPIGQTDDTSFNKFAVNLAISIRGLYTMLQKETNSFVVALNGEWGSGKSTLINLMVEEITESEYEKINIIRFNPWNFSSSEDLIKKFFLEVVAHLDNNKKNEKLVEILRKYTNIISMANDVLDLKVIEKATKLGKIVIDLNTNYHYQEGTLENIKKELNKALEDKKILVIIDDIDRLLPNQVAQIFQLVKSVGDLKNIVYVLAFDKNVVNEYLKSIPIYNPEKYVEKIIQVSLDIPILSKTYIANYFKDKLKELGIEVVTPSGKESYMFLPGAMELYKSDYAFKNMRSLKKYINVLNFEYELVKDEVDKDDFVVITYIKVFYFDVYMRIYKNKSIVTDKNILKNCDELMDQLIGNKNNDDKELLKSLLDIIFPILNKYYKKNKNDDDRYNTRGIWNIMYFDYYFSLIPFNLSKTFYSEVFRKDNFKDLCNELKKISQRDRRIFLKVIKVHVKEIRESQLEKFLYLIFSNSNKIQEDYNISIRYASEDIRELIYVVVKDEHKIDIFLLNIYRKIIIEEKLIENLNLLYIIQNSFSSLNNNVLASEILSLFKEIYEIFMQELSNNNEFIFNDEFKYVISFVCERVHEGRIIEFVEKTYKQILKKLNELANSKETYEDIQEVFKKVNRDIEYKRMVVREYRISELEQKIKNKLIELEATR